jgi:hypothetical protein
MPDVTISFTDAQWTRIVAASAYIKGADVLDSPGNVTADYLAASWKESLSTKVKQYEQEQASVDDF